MANTTTFPIRMNGTDLCFGDLTVPLKTGTSFWADKQKHEIEVHCQPAENYWTTFRFHLENVQNMHQCIGEFMKNTEMRPSLFFTRSVKPIIAEESDEKSEIGPAEKASVRFEFMHEEDREYFLTYALPMLPGFETETSMREDKLYCATLTYSESETQPNQIARINAVFNRIMDKFGDSAIKGALLELRDKRFPTEPYPPGRVCDRDWAIDHGRDYDVTKEEMNESVSITRETTVQVPVKTEELEQWNADPASQVGKHTKRYQQYLTALIEIALQEKPVDNAKLKPLMDAALSIPGFNIVEVFQKLAVND